MSFNQENSIFFAQTTLKISKPCYIEKRDANIAQSVEQFTRNE